MTEEDIEQMWSEAIDEELWEEEKLNKIKDGFKKELKGLINVSGLFRYLDEMDYWSPEGFVDVVETDEKAHGYPDSYQCARVTKDDYKLYMKVDMDEPFRGTSWYYVWQTTGYHSDDYYGNLLFELKDGRYFKISYSC